MVVDNVVVVVFTALVDSSNFCFTHLHSMYTQSTLSTAPPVV